MQCCLQKYVFCDNENKKNEIVNSKIEKRGILTGTLKNGNAGSTIFITFLHA